LERIKRSLGENFLEVLEADSEGENLLDVPQMSQQKKEGTRPNFC